MFENNPGNDRASAGRVDATTIHVVASKRCTIAGGLLSVSMMGNGWQTLGDRVERLNG
jgi:hypothetical protein